jgi:hypothetical protein
MEPGRELDRLIAEKVMGWSPVKGDPSSFENPSEFQDEWMSRHAGVWQWLPAYSTDIAAAWEVVEKLKTIPGKPEEWGDGFDTPFEIRISWMPSFSEWQVAWSPAYWIYEHEASAATAPHAICLAALRVVTAQP